MIPFLDLKTIHCELQAEIVAAWQRILEDGAFVGGPEVEGFEREFAAYVGARHCVGVSNGTDALLFALLALGLRPGDQVITASHTFIGTSEPIGHAGGKPVFVDVDAATGTLDPALVEAAITPRTRFLLPVHLYGQPADMGPLLDIARRHDLKLVEDACQAHGAEYRGRRAGSLGHAAGFSFYPGKNLGACGEGGAVTTDDAAVAARVRQLRDHGQVRKYHHEIEGYNGRLDALQAAALRIKLRHLDGWNEQRRRAAATYAELLVGSPFELPTEAPGRKHVYHLYVVRHPERERVQAALTAAGIGTGLHYPVPLHLQPPYRSSSLPLGSLPRSEHWASAGLSLPMYPNIDQGQQARVAEALRRAVA